MCGMCHSMFELTKTHSLAHPPSSLSLFSSPLLSPPLSFALRHPLEISRRTVLTGTHAIASSQEQDKFFFFVFSLFFFFFLFWYTNVERSTGFFAHEQHPRHGHSGRSLVTATSSWRATPHPRCHGLSRHVARHCDAPPTLVVVDSAAMSHNTTTPHDHRLASPGSSACTT